MTKFMPLHRKNLNKERRQRKLNHDLAAVKNALRERWSNGPVEGYINRLKTLKRQMWSTRLRTLNEPACYRCPVAARCTEIEEEPLFVILSEHDEQATGRRSAALTREPVRAESPRLRLAIVSCVSRPEERSEASGWCVEGLEMATGPATADDPKERGSVLGGAWTRAGLLALLFIAVNVWTTHHLGWGLENPFGLAGFSAGVGLFVALLEKWVSANGELKVRVTSIPIWLVALLYLICAIFAITRSSVLVLNEPGRPPSRPPRLLQAGSEQEIQSTISDGGLVRFVVSTSPFGRPYRLRVPGFRELTLQVYPFAGVTISPERDLKISPSVLFRPPKSALVELDPKAGGIFLVQIGDGAKRKTIAVDACHPTSFLVGQEQAIPPEWPEMWKLETESLGFTDGDKDSASTRLQWKRFTLLAPGVELQPNTVLEARVITRAGVTIARARTTLREDNLADVSMTEESTRNTEKLPEVPPCGAQ